MGLLANLVTKPMKEKPLRSALKIPKITKTAMSATRKCAYDYCPPNFSQDTSISTRRKTLILKDDFEAHHQCLGGRGESKMSSHESHEVILHHSCQRTCCKRRLLMRF